MKTMSGMNKTWITFFYVTSLFVTGCKETTNKKFGEATTNATHLTTEKAAILNTLNNETEAFFNRDYDLWQNQWLHEAFIGKSYMILTDSSMSETLGWSAIDKFARTYFEAHPEKDPLPNLLSDIEVRLYVNGAWVSFMQNDPIRGLKRETRLMEKVDGEWKIAGMHTTVY